MHAPAPAPTALVGRDRELAILRRELDAAIAGRGSLVLIGGEAGIGKTALAEVVCREAAEHGALVLVGRCYDLTETPPYGPWVEMLDHLRALPDRSPTLRAVAVPSIDRSVSQEALFAQMRGFLAAIARERPLVVLLDDLHWADSASLDLLRFIARQIAASPILLLVTYRSDEIPRRHPLSGLLPALIRETQAERIDVHPLGDDDVRALIDQTYHLPTGETNRLAAYVQERAEGNPFFLGELLRTLHETTLIWTAAHAWTLNPLTRIRVPTLLRQVIDARLARLGAEADDLLAVATMIGQVAPLALWAKVSGASEAALLPLIERGIEARVFDAPADGMAVHFAHALIREALDEGVLPPQRRVWHREIGEALCAEREAPDPDAVAYHFSQAGDARATQWLIRAGAADLRMEDRDGAFRGGARTHHGRRHRVERAGLAPLPPRDVAPFRGSRRWGSLFGGRGAHRKCDGRPGAGRLCALLSGDAPAHGRPLPAGDRHDGGGRRPPRRTVPGGSRPLGRPRHDQRSARRAERARGSDPRAGGNRALCTGTGAR